MIHNSAKGKPIEYNWYSKNCHVAPMWCAPKNCQSREEYAAFQKEKRENCVSGGPHKPPTDATTGAKLKMTDDFKIAFMAMIGEEATGELTDQFSEKKRIHIL